MPAETFDWYWEGRPAPIRAEIDGEGLRANGTIFLLPPPSTVSSRSEMAPLAALLSRDRRTIALDWPGFGTGTHLDLPYGPALMQAFLADAVDRLADGPTAVLAVGHASSYALHLARGRPGSVARIALVAPTWRGPLPTMMGGRKPVQDRIRDAIRLPVIGHALYRVNVSDRMIATMYRRHVYADPGRITPEFVSEKHAIASRAGGRYASGAFVTGALDVVHDRQAFLDLVPPSVPTLVVYGADTPRRSLAEMEAIAALAGVRSMRLPAGSLGLHEEMPDMVFEACGRFLLDG